SVVEHSLGKGEVARSIRAMGTTDPHGDRDPVGVRREARPGDLGERARSMRQVDKAGRWGEGGWSAARTTNRTGIQQAGVFDNGKRQIRADEAARERWDDWSRGPRQDDADGGDHDGAGVQVWW